MSEQRENASFRVYVGNLARQTNADDLEELFGKYGRVLDVSHRGTYAFVTLAAENEADMAVEAFNDQTLDGNRLRVERSVSLGRGAPRAGSVAASRVREGSSSRACYSCGSEGHLARDCSASSTAPQDAVNLCWKCGQTGHVQNECQNKPLRADEQFRLRSASIRARSRARAGTGAPSAGPSSAGPSTSVVGTAVTVHVNTNVREEAGDDGEPVHARKQGRRETEADADAPEKRKRAD